MKKQLLLLALSCSALCSGTVFAQSAYPCAVVKFVSPYPPGGTTDILARMLAPGLAKQLGTNVVVENKGGASSNIGAENVASATPNGTRFYVGSTANAINKSLYKNLNYDIEKNIESIRTAWSWKYETCVYVT